MSRASEARRAARRAAEAPFDDWERREIPPGTYEAFFGRADAGENGITHAFVNSRYSVQVSTVETTWGPVMHLWIRRHDGAPARSWADLQRIKNELAGPDATAVEVFPPTADLVDAANMYHLWVLPPGMRLPFTLPRKESSDAA